VQLADLPEFVEVEDEMMTTTMATTEVEAGWTPILRRSPWSCMRITPMPQMTARRMVQEEAAPIQVP
jgi:hypothetical protein